MNRYNELESFERKLTEKIVAFSDDSSSDHRVVTLWNEHNRNRVASERTGDVMHLNANAAVAQQERNNNYSRMVCLPMKWSMTLDEYNLLVRTDELTFGSIEQVVQYSPINQLNDGFASAKLVTATNYDGSHGMQVFFTTRGQSSETVLVHVIISTLDKNLVSRATLRETQPVIYQERLTLHVNDVIRVRSTINQFVKDVTLTPVSDENTLDLETYDVSERVVLFGSISISVIRPNVTLDNYKDAEVTYRNVLKHATEIDSLMSADTINAEISGELLVNVITNFQDIALKPSFKLSSVVLQELYDRRNELDDITYATMLQTSLYSTAHELLLSELEDDTPLLQTFALSVKNAQMLAELTSKVVMYEKKEYSITGEAELAMIHPLTPFYGQNYKTDFAYDQGGADTSIKWHSDLLTFEGREGPHNWDSMISEEVKYSNGGDTIVETHQIYEDDSIWIFTRFQFTRSPGQELRKPEYIQGVDKTRVGVTSWSQLNVPLPGMTGQLLAIGDGNISVRGFQAVNNVLIQRIIVCPKNAAGKVGHVEQDLSWNAYYNDQNYTGRCHGGNPERVIYGGNDYEGVGYDVNFQLPGGNRLSSIYLLINDGRYEALMTMTPTGQVTRETSGVMAERGIDYDLVSAITTDNTYTTIDTTFSTNALKAFWVPDVIVGGMSQYKGRKLENWFNLDPNSNRLWQGLSIVRSIGLIMQLRGSVTLNTPMAPVLLGVTSYGNEYLYMQAGINMDIMSDIRLLREEIKSVADYVSQLRIEFERFLSSQQTGLIDVILQVLIEVALPIAIGGVAMIGGAMLSKLTQIEKSMAGSTWRHSSRGVSQMANRGILMNSAKGTKLPQVDINESTNFNQLYLKSRDKDLLSITDGTRPLFKTNPNKSRIASEFDVAEKMDIAVAVKTGGKYNLDSYPSAPKVSMSRNNLSDDIPLPTANVYYRPLGTLPDGIGLKLHKGVTMRSDIKSKLQHDAYNATNKLPSHSFMTMDSISILDSGRYRYTRDYFGIGELNTKGRTVSDKGAGIGHVNISYDSFCRTRNGKVYYTLAGYEKDGYTPIDVDNLFNTLFTGKRGELTNVLTTDEKWEYISNEVSKKIIGSDKVATAVIGDQSRLLGIRKLAKMPMEWKYDLLYNNCQTFSNSVLNYVSGKGVPESWNQFMKSVIVTERIRFKDDLLGISEVSSKMATKFKSNLRSKRIIR